MATPNTPSPQDAQSLASAAQQQADAAQLSSQAYSNMLQTMISIGQQEKARDMIAVDIANKQKAEMTAFNTLLARKREAGKLDISESLALTKKLKDNQALIGTYQLKKKLAAETEAIEKMALDLAKSRGKTEKEIADTVKKRVQDEEKANQLAKHRANFNAANQKTGALTNLNMGEGGARSAVDTATGFVGAHAGKIAENAGFTGLSENAPGAIGAIVGIVKALVDLSSIGRVAAAGLVKANASMGTLTENMRDFDVVQGRLSALKGTITIVQKYGMTFDEMTQKMNAAAGAGISLSEIMDNDYKGLIQLNSAAVATGTDVGTISAVLVTMRRNLKGFNNTGEEAIRLAGAAQQVAKADIMNTQEFVSTMSSLSDELADLNMSFDDTINMTTGLMLKIKSFGVSAKVTKEITGELIKSFHTTTDEWKAFIGAKSGFGGGFLGGLFGAQQRGAGGDLLNRQADPKVWMKQMMNFLKTQTQGVADPRARLYMQERLGQNMGLDAKSTQALLRGANATNPQEQQKALDDMVQAAKTAESDSKSNFEKLAAILEGTIAKVLNAILSSVVWIANHFGASITNPLGDAEKMGKAMGQTPQKAGGGEIYNSGLIVAHRKEQVLDANEATNYRMNRNRNNAGGSSINITVNVSGDIDRAFEKAKQDTKRQLKKANSYAWGM